MHGSHPAWESPPIDGVDPLSARAFDAFVLAGRLHFKHLRDAMADSGCHHGQAMCLRLLSFNDGLSQSDIARMLGVAPPTVSRMLDALERSDLVERRPDDADQRLTRVFLTRDGREHERMTGVTVSRYITATFGALTERDRRELTRLLERLGERIAAAGVRHKEPRSEHPRDDRRTGAARGSDR